MNIIELISKSMNVSSIDVSSAHDPKSTAPGGLRSHDFSAYLTGLTRIQQDLIYCKYLSDVEHCRKGLKSYRSHLYRSTHFINWVKFLNNPDRLSDGYADTVMERTSNSPILQQMAWEEMIGTNRCPECLGAGRWDIPESGVEAFDCESCKGRGVLAEGLSAQYRADRLHVSVSTYWRKWDEVFNRHYRQPLIKQETEAIVKIMKNWSG